MQKTIQKIATRCERAYPGKIERDPTGGIVGVYSPYEYHRVSRVDLERVLERLGFEFSVIRGEEVVRVLNPDLDSEFPVDHRSSDVGGGCRSLDDGSARDMMLTALYRFGLWLDPGSVKRVALDLAREAGDPSAGDFAFWVAEFDRATDFAVWIKSVARATDDPAGDFVRDAREDAGFPRCGGVRAVRGYLRSRGACREALEALEELRPRYRRSVRAEKWVTGPLS